MMVLLNILSFFSDHLMGRSKLSRLFILQMIAIMFTAVESYELKDVACHDVTEETVDLQMKWFGEQKCFDRHGIEYWHYDYIRSCAGCVSFRCSRFFEPTTQRYEYFWSVSNVDNRCCLSCEGKLFPEGTNIAVTASEPGICSTEAKTTCLYNPLTRKGEITEEYSLQTCCLDNDGLHPIATEVLETSTCSVRECQAPNHYRGHPAPYWVMKRSIQDCNCCQHDGVLIPPGGWVLAENNLNLTCCEGKLLEETLTQCQIESLIYQLDTSGSMSSSISVWKPLAVNLVEEMVTKKVNIDQHYLFSYVTNIHSVVKTDDYNIFRDKVQNWNSFSGGTELTFAGLKHALSQVNTNAFVCIWTDEIGDDTHDATLEAEIIALKTKTKSEIFFMIVTDRKPTIPHLTTMSPYPYPWIGRRKKRQVYSNIMKRSEPVVESNEQMPNETVTEDKNPDDVPSKKRALFDNFQSRFGRIGHVMDISTDPDALSKVVDIMKKSALCDH